jgi:hypothetical protein
MQQQGSQSPTPLTALLLLLLLLSGRAVGLRPPACSPAGWAANGWAGDCGAGCLSLGTGSWCGRLAGCAGRVLMHRRQQ